MNLEQQRKGTYSAGANARTQFRLAQILRTQKKDLDRVLELEASARKVLAELLPAHPLDKVDDEIALYDHLQPVFDGRFAGRSLLKHVCKKHKGERLGS